uniref:3-oxo-5-alpha-steroid 4-dehydrogenase n=1 Tax=Toxoplasma gondii COUG TaxID=1074873 RepID=A0A2G8Y4T1_TOXGO|nr:3-oxo-5-alpha-steroid 4-dehydrogenase [Toxoplasma gondii COUG]
MAFSLPGMVPERALSVTRSLLKMLTKFLLQEPAAEHVEVDKSGVYLFWAAVGLAAFGLVTVVGQIFIRAPWGKFRNDAKSRVWGPSVPCAVAWMIQECPSFFIPFSVLVGTEWLAGRPINKILLVLFTTHYAHRSLVYPARLYVHTRYQENQSMPLGISAMAVLFCTYNGMIQSWSAISFDYSSELDPFLAPRASVDDCSAALRLISGVCVFLWGMSVNIRSDYILMKLRVTSDRITPNPVLSASAYRIPEGLWFNYVSCANYFGEICEWAGYAIACNTYVALSFAVFTLCFLTGRGVQVHRWYLQHFEERYPSGRKAVIPFIV